MMSDAPDLVKRLRALRVLDEVGSDNPLGRDAADQIEALRDGLMTAIMAKESAENRLRIAADRAEKAERDAARLREAATALYMAGRWSCDRDVDEAALWTAMRDAIGLPEGTARRAGLMPDTEAI